MYKRPVSIDYDNFELNWFHEFSQVSANSFRFIIQKCSRSLYAFIVLHRV